MARNQFSAVKEYSFPVINITDRIQEIRSILSDFKIRDTVNRIWNKHHTVWKPEPSEISNRLGWLNIIDRMVDRVAGLEEFARDIQQRQFRNIVLLGMGGSSLGPEVLRQSLGSAPHYPDLIVLDSTVPAWIESVRKAIEIRHSLFLVSSKSGTTAETMAFYHYFRSLVNDEVGQDMAGNNFVAITDKNTPLNRMASTEGFLRTFENPSDIGGRYSVLSYFGLVPAALTGLDIRTLINRAAKMQERCAPCVDVNENPALWLGAVIGSFALHGRNKLTFILSPSISSLGLWLEQLIAESTGKEGKGIIPVVSEPLLKPEYYGDDRLFVYIRLKGDRNYLIDEAVLQLEVNGYPIIQLEIYDQYDLGAEFFRWEFATAVAGAILGVNPFDQPDVQSSKDAASGALQGVISVPGSNRMQSTEYLVQSLEKMRPDSYVALMAYLKQAPAIDRALNKLRKKISGKYHLATTLGYGPRFLHSTGQLHKGGPDNVLFVQITAKNRKDIKIPGQSYTFGMLLEAQYQGDYEALETKGRKILRIQLPGSSGAAIGNLAGRI